MHGLLTDGGMPLMGVSNSGALITLSASSPGMEPVDGYLNRPSNTIDAGRRGEKKPRLDFFLCPRPSFGVVDVIGSISQESS